MACAFGASSDESQLRSPGRSVETVKPSSPQVSTSWASIWPTPTVSVPPSGASQWCRVRPVGDDRAIAPRSPTVHRSVGWGSGRTHRRVRSRSAPDFTGRPVGIDITPPVATIAPDQVHRVRYHAGGWQESRPLPRSPRERRREPAIYMRGASPQHRSRMGYELAGAALAINRRACPHCGRPHRAA